LLLQCVSLFIEIQCASVSSVYQLIFMILLPLATNWFLYHLTRLELPVLAFCSFMVVVPATLITFGV